MSGDDSSVKDDSIYDTYSSDCETSRYTKHKCTYLGYLPVNAPTGIGSVRLVLTKLSQQSYKWMKINLEIGTSNFRMNDYETDEVVREIRVRFLAFLGMSEDAKYCGFIVGDDDEYFCHGFKAEPNCIELCMAMKKACQERYQRVIDSGNISAENLKIGETDDTPITIKVPKESKKKKLFNTSKFIKNTRSKKDLNNMVYGNYTVYYIGNGRIPYSKDLVYRDHVIQVVKSVQKYRRDVFIEPDEIEFQISEAGLLLTDKHGKWGFDSKNFKRRQIKYCLKLPGIIAIVVEEEEMEIDVHVLVETVVGADIMIETIQKALNES